MSTNDTLCTRIKMLSVVDEFQAAALSDQMQFVRRSMQMHPQILRTLSSARTRLRAELEAIECNTSVRTAEREEVLQAHLAIVEKKLRQAECARH